MNQKPTPDLFFANLFREHSLLQLLVLALEQWVQPFINWIRGLTGFALRTLFYKLIFRQSSGISYVAPGITMQRGYGISADERLAVRRSTIIDGKG